MYQRSLPTTCNGKAIRFLFLILFVDCCDSESTFIRSVEDVVSKNAECHIHLMIVQPLQDSFRLKSPLTIKRIKTDLIENKEAVANSSISAVGIRGINCIYLIFLQVHKQACINFKSEYPTRSNSTTTGDIRAGSLDRAWNSDCLSFVPFDVIDKGFLRFGKDQGDLPDRLQYRRPGPYLYSSKRTTMVIFVKLNISDLQTFKEKLQCLYTTLCKSSGLVLFSEEDFERNRVSNISTTKSIQDYLCENCATGNEGQNFNVTFGLASLRLFHTYLKSISETKYHFTQQNSWLQVTIDNRSRKSTHPAVASKFYSKTGDLRKILDYYIIETIIRARNFSLEFSNFRSFHSYTPVYPSEIIWEDPLFFGVQFPGEMLLLEKIRYSFLTCNSNPLVTMEFFISPFEPSLWVYFIVASISISVLWSKLHNILSKQGGSFSVILLVISSITDDSVGIPEYLSKNLAFRCSFVTWFLATVVLVNGYIGVLMSAITSPFDLESIHSFSNLSVPLKTYSQINEQFLWCRMACGGSYFSKGADCEKEKNKIIPRDFDDKEDFRILSSPLAAYDDGNENCSNPSQQWKISSFMNRLVQFYDRMSSYSNCEYFWWTNENKERPLLPEQKTQTENAARKYLEQTVYNLIYPSHNGIPQSAKDLYERDRENYMCYLKEPCEYEDIVEQELMKCERTVFADEHNKVLAELEYLKKQYRKVSFFTSEQIWPLERFWDFQGVDNYPKLLIDVKLLISSGIYQRSLQYFETYKYYERSRISGKRRLLHQDPKEPKPLKLEGKFQSLFYVFACLYFSFVSILVAERFFYCICTSRRLRVCIFERVRILRHFLNTLRRDYVAWRQRLNMQKMG